jgi:hypothetical protein
VRRGVATLALFAVVAVSWSQILDRTALTETRETWQRALAAFAVARALNGVISVAQGTELALQPVGVGVTLTVGEVLDPLNDLVENFAWLALLASVSLGTQMLLAEAVGNAWMNGLLTVAAGAYLAALWWPGASSIRITLMRTLTLVVFARFLFALITLATAWVDNAVLAERQEAAMSRIEVTQAHIEELQENPPTPPETVPGSEASVLERLGAFLDDQRQALDVRAQLQALTERVENAIEEIVNLLVVFTVQTILVPVAALLLAYWSFLWLWRWSWRGNRSP